MDFDGIRFGSVFFFSLVIVVLNLGLSAVSTLLLLSHLIDKIGLVVIKYYKFGTNATNMDRWIKWGKAKIRITTNYY